MWKSKKESDVHKNEIGIFFRISYICQKKANNNEPKNLYNIGNYHKKVRVLHIHTQIQTYVKYHFCLVLLFYHRLEWQMARKTKIVEENAPIIWNHLFFGMHLLFFLDVFLLQHILSRCQSYNAICIGSNRKNATFLFQQQFP